MFAWLIGITTRYVLPCFNQLYWRESWCTDFSGGLDSKPNQRPVSAHQMQAIRPRTTIPARCGSTNSVYPQVIRHWWLASPNINLRSSIHARPSGVVVLRTKVHQMVWDKKFAVQIPVHSLESVQIKVSQQQICSNGESSNDLPHGRTTQF